jgi:hypothetical protein
LAAELQESQFEGQAAVRGCGEVLDSLRDQLRAALARCGGGDQLFVPGWQEKAAAEGAAAVGAAVDKLQEDGGGARHARKQREQVCWQVSACSTHHMAVHS